MKSGLEVKNGNDNDPTGFNIKLYYIDYKHIKFIQFHVMPPIMPPFYFVTLKKRH